MKWIFIFTFSLFGLRTWGLVYDEPDPLCLYKATERLARNQLDSSVEIELDASSNVMRLLTTEDGTVGALFKGQEIPLWFYQDSKKLGLKPRERLWESLSVEEQKKLILAQDISSGELPLIRGLQVKPKLDLWFDEPTHFLGREFTAGKHRVDLSAYLGGKVERRDLTDITEFNGVELHFRSPQSAGANSRDAWRLLAALGIEKNHQHVHIVSSIPSELLRKNPRLQSFVMTDYHRRANLATEMMNIVEDKMSILENPNFGSLESSYLPRIYQKFVELSQGKKSVIGDTFKFAWVGFRGSDKYDQPGLWGLEVRGISERSHSHTVEQLLNGLQKGMHDNDYGIDLETASRYLNLYPGQKPGEQLAKLWYQAEWEELFQRLPEKLRRRVGWFGKRYFVKEMTPDKEPRKEFQMIFYNWIEDPLFFEASEGTKKKVLKAQSKAIKELKKGKFNNETMSRFLLDSGIYQTVMRSVHVNVEYLGGR